MAIASDRTGTPKRRHGIADSMPAFAYHAMRPQRTRIASRCDRLGASQVDRRAIWPIPHHQTTQPPRGATWQSHRTEILPLEGLLVPVSTRRATRPSHYSQIPPQPHYRSNEKPSADAEKSLSVGRRLSITGNHGIWRQISTIICRQTRNAPIRRATRPCRRPSQQRHRRQAGPHWPRIRRR